MFCKSCGGLLTPMEGGMGCQTCNKKSSGDTKIVEEKKKEKKIEILEKSNENLPKTDADCPKCDCLRAYYWTAQTRSADEPETVFLICTKCEYKWRQY